MATITTDTNLTAVAYAAGEVIDVTNNATLTINTTPAVKPGTILITNTSTTTPNRPVAKVRHRPRRATRARESLPLAA